MNLDKAREALYRAATYLSADQVATGTITELRPGVHYADAKYAFAHRENGWAVVTGAELIDLAERLDDPELEHSALQDWLSNTPAAHMPTWWSPRQMFAWRMDDGMIVMHDPGDFATCITADLETGKEIPA